MKRLTQKGRLCRIVCLCFCLISVFLMILIRKEPYPDKDSLTRYLNKHEQRLLELASDHPDTYKNVNAFGIKSIDTRSDDVEYTFSWSFDVAEGGKFLYYASDGILENSGYTFTDDEYIDGLGINGKGYIQCTRLKENWFFVEYMIPT